MKTGTHGYVVLHRPGHLLATKEGAVLEHRIALWDKLAGQDLPCHWCAKEIGWFSKDKRTQLLGDHIDFNKLNNNPDNIVPACIECNNRRSPDNPTAEIRLCIVPDCEIKHKANGYCYVHLGRLRFGSLELKGRGKPSKYVGCMIEDCEKKHHARGYCAKHYMTEWYEKKNEQRSD